MWHDQCPLSRYISPRTIASSGFSLKTSVKDLTANGAWKWPIAWYDLFPVLINIPPPPLLLDKVDEVKFSTSIVWNTIRNQSESVQWVNLVWFSQCIPRHAFNLWLILKRKLKTQDRLRPWEVGSATNLNLMCCSFCQHGPDSHDHLFFECIYARQVWSIIKPLAGMHQVTAIWNDIINWLIPLAKSKTIKSVIGRLLVAAAAYFIWQERNNRLFSSKERSVSQLANGIQ